MAGEPGAAGTAGAVGTPGGNRRARLRAVLETLRAPLLLSPIGDVLAGWSVGLASWAYFRAPGLGLLDARAAGHLLAALGAGAALLAAGMATNALVDLPDDRLRKPERPLPRGAVGVTTVRALAVALTVAAVLLALAVRPLLPWVLTIVALSGAYHLGLKRWRIPGCLALGACRGLDMFLGAVAARAAFVDDTSFALLAPAEPLWPPLVCTLYGLYVTGASLHASTDDEPGGDTFSRAGLDLALGTIAAGALLSTWLAGRHGDVRLLGTAVLLLAGARLVDARRRKPPPAITGAALSNLLLLTAATCFGAGQPVGGGIVLGLFAVSRLALRAFPPT